MANDSNLIEQQVERCLELYGAPGESIFPRKVDLASYEQMRADMMIMVGIVSAMLAARSKDRSEP